MVEIAGIPIGPDYPPRIVAELSSNHMGRFEVAQALIRTAKECGADFVKFQYWRSPADLTLDSHEPRFTLQSGPWKGRRLWDLYAEAQTPPEWFPDLFAYAREVGIPAFSSVVAPSGVEDLEKLGCPAYKIPSPEIGNEELIDRARATDMPIIASTGLFNRNSAFLYRDIVLHCVSEYPAESGRMGLWRIAYLRERCGDPVGLSDHSVDPRVPPLAVAAGASMIEAHLMLDGTHPLDEGHSYTPGKFAAMVRGCQDAYEICREREPSGEAEGFRRRLVNGQLVRCGP